MSKRQRITGNEKNYTLDTCVIIKICENPNIGNLLSCRINFHDSKVFINSQTVYEAKKHGYSFENVYQSLRDTLGTKVVYEEISENLKNYADVLESLHPTLHAGDAEILAFAQSKHSVLLSCDKGFLIAAKRIGVKFVNPDILPCDVIAKKVKTRYYRVVKNSLKENSQTKNNLKHDTFIKKTVNDKTKSSVNKPIKKIVWSSFI